MSHEPETGSTLQPQASDPPLWRFSLRYYRRAGVADTCLALQDRCGVDVNVLLCLLWLALAGRQLSVDELTWLDDGVAGWRNIAVRPLRTIRRALRDDRPLPDHEGVDELRGRIKGLELQAEKLQQLELARLAGPLVRNVLAVSVAAAADANIAAYQTMLGCDFSERARMLLTDALRDHIRDQSGQETIDDDNRC